MTRLHLRLSDLPDAVPSGRGRVWLLLVFGGLLACSAAGAGKPGGPVDFNRDIRPILSDNCFACHGPDEKERKAKLRLDVKEDALRLAKSGDYAIVPGDLT